MFENSPVPLPKGWPNHTVAAFVHAVSLARQALTVVRGWALDSQVHRVQLRAKVEGLEAEVALTRTELELLRARFERLAAKHRPHFTPPERLRALELRAARG